MKYLFSVILPLFLFGCSLYTSPKFSVGDCFNGSDESWEKSQFKVLEIGKTHYRVLFSSNPENYFKPLETDELFEFDEYNTKTKCRGIFNNKE